MAAAIDAAPHFSLSLGQVCQAIGPGFTEMKLNYLLDEMEEREMPLTVVTGGKQRRFPLDTVEFVVYYAWSRRERNLASSIDRAVAIKGGKLELADPRVAQRLVMLRVPLTLDQVTKIVGISKTQLDYWTKNGEVPTEGKTQRLYLPSAVAQLLLIKQAVDIGLRPGKAFKLVRDGLLANPDLMGPLQWDDLPLLDLETVELAVSLESIAPQGEHQLRQLAERLSEEERPEFYRRIAQFGREQAESLDGSSSKQ